MTSLVHLCPLPFAQLLMPQRDHRGESLGWGFRLELSQWLGGVACAPLPETLELPGVSVSHKDPVDT